MRVLVCGGRDYADRLAVYRALDELGPDFVIEGGATGADRFASDWADDNGVGRTRYDADFRQFGSAAGHFRNKMMLRAGRPDLVMAFPGGRGTADMVRQTYDAGIEVRRVG